MLRQITQYTILAALAALPIAFNACVGEPERSVHDRIRSGEIAPPTHHYLHPRGYDNLDAARLRGLAEELAESK